MLVRHRQRAVFFNKMAVKIYPPQVSEGQSKVLSADFPKTNDTLTNVTAWTLNFDTGHTYQIRIVFSMECAAVGGKMAFAGGSVVAANVNGFWSGNFGGPLSESINDLSTSHGFGSGDNGWAEVIMTLTATTGGTFIPTFAQQTTDAGATSLITNSVITAQDVTP